MVCIGRLSRFSIPAPPSMSEETPNEDGVLRYPLAIFQKAHDALLSEKPEAVAVARDRMQAMIGSSSCFTGQAKTGHATSRPPRGRGGRGAQGPRPKGGGWGGGHGGTAPAPTGAAERHKALSRAREQARTTADASDSWLHPFQSRGGGGGLAMLLTNVSAGTRALMGCLNKLSDQNYVVIVGRLRAVLDMGTATAIEFGDAVLLKSWQEDCYAALYVRMLREVIATDVAEEAAARFATPLLGAPGSLLGSLLQDYLKAEVLSDEAGGAAAAPGSDAYDLLCASVRARKHLMGRHRTLLLLMAGGLLGQPGQPDQANIPTPSQHLQTLMDVIATSEPQAVPVILDMLLDAAKLFPELSSAAAKDGRLEAALGPAIVETAPLRNRCKAMDVLQEAAGKGRGKAAPTQPTQPKYTQHSRALQGHPGPVRVGCGGGSRGYGGGGSGNGGKGYGGGGWRRDQ